jgi:hypothetical protein
MMTTKPKILIRFGALLLTLIFTLNILQFPSQQQHYQNAIAQQQVINETTSSISQFLITLMSTIGSIPENARGPAIPQDKGYLIRVRTCS